MTPAQAKLKSWRENPIQYVYDNFKVDADLWQKDFLESLVSGSGPRRRRAMKACTGPGKSAALSWAGWWRLSCFADKGEHPKGAALSGEGADNLRDNLWAEFPKWQARSDFLMAAFRWGAERIVSQYHSETWFLSARSYPKDANSEAIGRSLSGLHSRYPFILLDETGDMPITVGQKAEQIFTGGVADGLIAIAGNPTSTEGLLYHVCTNGAELWVVITITADPDDPKRTPRVDIEHARDQIKTYGRDNPWVMATILGLFPPSSINSLLGPDDVEASFNRQTAPENYEFAQKRLGIDVARFGSDRTVIFPRQGIRAFNPVILRNANTLDIAARAAEGKMKWGSEAEFIDGTGGFGGGVVDALRQAGHNPMEIHFSGSPIDDRYANRRAEMWFKMADWVKSRGSLPKLSELKKELVTPTYTFKNGKFLLEPKEMMKKRLGYSPDLADALALTFALPELPTQVGKYGEVASALQQTAKCDTEFDPYS